MLIAKSRILLEFIKSRLAFQLKNFMHSYFFILGNNSALSTAEILNKFQPRNYFLISRDVFRVDFEKEIKAQKVIEKIGGTIKIVEILEEDYSNLSEIVKRYLPENFEGKYKFGFSFYGEGRKNFKEIAMKIKKGFKNKGISSRWIISKEPNLSSVVVSKNKLIETESDFVIVKSRSKEYLGKTVAIQNFKELSSRDYDRPARDSYSGMIPPKLAQIMLNIGLGGKTDKILLDPFCGSGTILMEASLMGVKKIIGSDLSEKALRDSQINLKWFKDKFKIGQVKNIQLKQADARQISDLISKESIDLIVTEPYLGPQRKIDDIEQVQKSLEKLYQKSLEEFFKILNKKGKIVMVWPVLRKAKNKFMNIKLGGFKISKVIPENLNLELSERKTLIYGRKDQKVWREIVVLEKK
jgi:tRNA G10  N-methylase Trm11